MQIRDVLPSLPACPLLTDLSACLATPARGPRAHCRSRWNFLNAQQRVPLSAMAQTTWALPENSPDAAPKWAPSPAVLEAGLDLS